MVGQAEFLIILYFNNYLSGSISITLILVKFNTDPIETHVYELSPS